MISILAASGGSRGEKCACVRTRVCGCVSVSVSVSVCVSVSVSGGVGATLGHYEAVEALALGV